MIAFSFAIEKAKKVVESYLLNNYKDINTIEFAKKRNTDNCVSLYILL